MITCGKQIIYNLGMKEKHVRKVVNLDTRKGDARSATKKKKKKKKKSYLQRQRAPASLLARTPSRGRKDQRANDQKVLFITYRQKTIRDLYTPSRCPNRSSR